MGLIELKQQLSGEQETGAYKQTMSTRRGGVIRANAAVSRERRRSNPTSETPQPGIIVLGYKLLRYGNL
jgi:hypothetical protein